jgi:uncharacterized damage-inducible protein DinB
MHNYFPAILKLAEYEVWCNLQMMDFLSGLSPEECRRDLGFGLRTPHRTISHIADVMRAWGGCIGPTIEAPVWPDYDEGETIHAIRTRIESIGRSFLAACRESHDQGVLAEERRLSQLFHLVTHGTHHRGQLLSMITLMGYPQPFEGGDCGGWSNQ